MYSVYIIKSLKDSGYYIGHTQDIDDRLTRHNQGRSKPTRNKVPWKLVYQELFKTKGEAMKREYEIKKMKSRQYIEQLIKQK